jgi:hypothetical protein
MLLVIAFSETVILMGGFKGRFSPQVAKIASYGDHNSVWTLGRVSACFEHDGRSHAGILYNDQCLRAEDGKANYLLIGDSTSAALWSGLSFSFPGDNIMLASVFGCKPHVNLVVFGPVPGYDAPLPRLLAYSIAWGKPGLAQRHLLSEPSAVDAEMQNLAATAWHVPYVSLYRAFCDNGSCAEYADAAHQVPLMADAGHLNEFGSAFVIRRVIDRGELRLSADSRPESIAAPLRRSYDALEEEWPAGKRLAVQSK